MMIRKNNVASFAQPEQEVASIKLLMPDGKEGQISVGERAGTPAPTANPDPFDPARMRLDQNFGMEAGVKKLLTTVPVMKASKEWFVRTHPDADYQISTRVLELKEGDHEIYLVDRD